MGCQISWKYQTLFLKLPCELWGVMSIHCLEKDNCVTTWFPWNYRLPSRLSVYWYLHLISMFTLKLKSHQGDCPVCHWRHWTQASTSPMMTGVVTLMTFPYLCMKYAHICTVYPIEYKYGWVMYLPFHKPAQVGLCDIFIHILQDYFTGTGAIFWLPQCPVK